MTEVDPIPTEGSQVGRYLFLREITKGPLGSLCELREEAGSSAIAGLGRVVPLGSDLSPEVEQSIAAAAWESMEIRHDSVLCVADVVFGEGWVMLIHDHSEGTLLKSLQRRSIERQSVFPLAIALRIVLDMLDGQDRSCSACESAGIPWNPGVAIATSLYLCGDGRTRLLDGQLMASLIRDRGTLERLGEGTFFAPELFDLEGKPDERTDVFAAGAVLWELLTGKELSLESEVVRGQSPRPTVPSVKLAVPEGTLIPDGIAQAVNSALELDPSRRPASRTAFRSALTEGVEAASYEKVIDFVDALLHRESTLFRLTLDPLPKLSDKLRSERPGPPRFNRGVTLPKRTTSADPSRAFAVKFAQSSNKATAAASAEPQLKPPPRTAPAAAPTESHVKLSPRIAPAAAAAEPQVKPSPRTPIAATSNEPQVKPSPRSAITAASTGAKKGFANRTLIGINPTASFSQLPRTSVAIDAKAIPVEPHSEVAVVAEPISIPAAEPPQPADTSDTDQTVVRYNVNAVVEPERQRDTPNLVPIPAPQIHLLNNECAITAPEVPQGAPRFDPNFVSEALRDLPNVVASIMADVQQAPPAAPAATVGQSQPLVDSSKPARRQAIQLSLPALIIVQLATVAIAVVATIVIQRTFWKNSSAPSISAIVVAAPTVSAPPMAASTPTPASPAVAVEATIAAPQASTAPSVEPTTAKAASPNAPPLTATTASAVPPDNPTAPKIVPRKHKRGYVPHGL